MRVESLRVPRAVTHHARNTLQFQPVRPAISAGLRAAIVTVVPLIIGQRLNLPNALWTTLAGFSVALVDKGGAYDRRAVKMGAVSAITVVAGFLGALVGHWTAWSVLTVGLWATLCALARVWGPDAVSVGVTGVVVFVISVTLPAPLRPAAIRAAYLAVGAGAAMLLSLFLWPVRMYRPGRLAVAELFRQLAEYARVPRATEVTVEEPTSPAGRVRAALEEARATLLAIRSGRRAEGTRGQRLTVVLESADQLYGRLGAMRHFIAEPAAEPALRAYFDEVAERCLALAASLENDRSGIVGPLPERPTFALPEVFPEAPALNQLRGEVEAFLSAAEDMVRSARGDPFPPPGVFLPQEPPAAESLSEGLALDSLVLRHALRVGVTVAAGVAIAGYLHLPHGYWVTVTIVVVLQPYVGQSWVKGLQRIGGTVVGGILAALLASWLHGGWGLMALIFVLAAASVALMPIHYGLYAIFLTPTFVLLTEAMENDWRLASVRVLNTLIGGGLALIGTFVLWPSPERIRVRAPLSDALDALAALVGQSPSRRAEYERARRRFGRAVLNAEESVQRVLTETHGPSAALEAMLVLVTYARRVSATVFALTSMEDSAELQRFRAEARAAVQDVSASVRDDRVPSPLPEWLHDSARGARLGPIGRGAAQLMILRDAAERLARSGDLHVPAPPPVAPPTPLAT